MSESEIRVEGQPHWFVYIAESRYKKYYVGITTNPLQRIKKHNCGKGSLMAKQQGPFILRYVSNPYSNKSRARIREIQLKRWSRSKKEKLILGKWR